MRFLGVTAEIAETLKCLISMMSIQSISFSGFSIQQQNYWMVDFWLDSRKWCSLFSGHTYWSRVQTVNFCTALSSPSHFLSSKPNRRLMWIFSFNEHKYAFDSIKLIQVRSIFFCQHWYSDYSVKQMCDGNGNFCHFHHIIPNYTVGHSTVCKAIFVFNAYSKCTLPKMCKLC